MPDTPKTPGQRIQELLDERGWSQKLVASLLRISVASFNDIISGRRYVDAALALRLSGVLGIPAKELLDLQQEHDLAEAQRERPPHDTDLPALADLFTHLPVAEMVRRRWVAATDVRDVDQVRRDLLSFFGVKTWTELISSEPAYAAKKSEPGSPTTIAQKAWLQRARRIAAEMVMLRPFSVATVRAASEELSALRISAAAARQVARIIADAGIRLVFVEGLRGSRIDGATFWLSPEEPVIAMSLRYDRIDNFWFVLAHELEHVARGHGKSQPIVDEDLELGTHGSEEERLANEAAANFCVPRADMESFIARKEPFFKESDTLNFAARMKVHPGLVAGQIRRRLDRWDLFTKHLVKIRSIVKEGAVVDGWGDVAPVDPRRTANVST